MSIYDPIPANSDVWIARQYQKGSLHRRTPLLLLPMRTLLFAAFQLLYVLVLQIGGTVGAWEKSATVWPFFAAMGSLVTLLVVSRLFKQEGLHYRDLLRLKQGSIGKDILTTLAFFMVSGPVAYLPNIFFGRLFFGDPMVPSKMMFETFPMPIAVLAVILFPGMVALTELPTYFGYILPRLKSGLGRGWLAVALPVFWLAFQHVTLPLIFDLRFMAWRFLMFLPFALMAGLLLAWRPRLLPYMMVGHLLMDISTGIFFIPGIMP